MLISDVRQIESLLGMYYQFYVCVCVCVCVCVYVCV